jgi:beta-mannosidase
VWHGNKPFSEYRKFHFRFCSEFGFQSFPSLKTVKMFTEPDDRNIFSYVMEKHQRNAAANNKIMSYMGDNFLYPGDFETLLYASQILQAEAVKYGVEHWRRNRGRCMGAVYWQLNDCWPVASWASIDYFGRWKALHYYAKRFFAPIMLSCCEEGVMTKNPNVNAEPYPLKKTTRLSVANESVCAFSGIVTWALRDTTGRATLSGEHRINAPALSSVWLDTLDFGDCGLYDNYFSFALNDESGKTVSEGSVLFCLPKHFRFINPRLAAHVTGDEITVTATAYAKSVEIDCDDADILLSDNYFDMNGGQKTVRILRGQPGNIRLRSIYDIR